MSIISSASSQQARYSLPRPRPQDVACGVCGVLLCGPLFKGHPQTSSCPWPCEGWACARASRSLASICAYMRVCTHTHTHTHTHIQKHSLSLPEVSSWNAASERPKTCGWGRGMNCLLRSCSALDFVNQDHEGRHWCDLQLGRIARRVEEAVRGGRRCQRARRCTHRIHSGCCPLIIHKHLLFSVLSFSNFYHGNNGLEEFQSFLATTEFHHT